MTGQLKGVSLAVLTAMMLSGCNSETESTQMAETSVAVTPVVVKLASVEDASATSHYQFPAKVEAFRTIDLSFEVSGKLQQVALNEGQHFKKGDVLASLNTDAFQRRVKQSQLQLHEARLELERLQSLDKKGYISHQKLTQAETQFELAKVALANSEADLGYSQLTAPFDGVVAKRLVETNAFVAPGAKIAELQDVSQTYFAVDLPEKLVVSLNREMNYQAKVQLPGLLNRSLGALEVRYAEHENDPNPITQTYRVYFSMPKSGNEERDKNIKVGSVSLLTLAIEDGAHTQGLTVPFSALVSQSSGEYAVWKFQPQSQTITLQPVTVQQLDGKVVFITSGLSKGEKVVSAGTSKMREGLLVQAYHGGR